MNTTTIELQYRLISFRLIIDGLIIPIKCDLSGYTSWCYKGRHYVGNPPQMLVNNDEYETFRVSDELPKGYFADYEKIIQGPLSQRICYTHAPYAPPTQWTLNVDNTEIHLTAEYHWTGVRYCIDNVLVAEQRYLFRNPLKMLRGIFSQTTIMSKNDDIIAGLMGIFVLSKFD